MATQPTPTPTEMPTPGDDTISPPHTPHEISTPAPDYDQPDTTTPSTDPDMATATPMGFAMPNQQAASTVGHREAGDTDDIGGTDRMEASTGGMAGTSR